MDPKLSAISPLDGRYSNQLHELSNYTSESALIKYRARIELEWVLFLAENKELLQFIKLPQDAKNKLRQLLGNLPDELPQKVKEIEASTNHDVKSVELYLAQYFKDSKITDEIISFIHFACTSEDINNISYALMLQDCRDKILLPNMRGVISRLSELARSYSTLPMISRTHGQTASPTTLGKELAVFAHRLNRQYQQLTRIQILAKMNGAVGNYNAHHVAFPDVDWQNVSKAFLKNCFNLEQNVLTTQIENHDNLVEYLDTVRRFNTILVDMSRDIWSYVSLGYFKLKVKDDEVGSSTMPHKVNPIDFENAEGNLGISVSLIQHCAEKLPISRWQRDLSDSTVLRNLGSIFGYSLLSYKSIVKGLDKLQADETKISKDINNAWEVLAEAIQTVMRTYGIANAYDELKKLTRGKVVDKQVLEQLINSQDRLPKDVKTRLLKLTPQEYIGLAKELTITFLDKLDDKKE